MVVEGSRRERFTDSDDAGMSNVRPSFDGAKGSLMHHSIVFLKRIPVSQQSCEI